MRRSFVLLLLLTVALAIQTSPSAAQLISVDKNYRIAKVDTTHHRLEVVYLSSDNVTLFVNIDGHTQVLNRHRRPMRWTLLRRGDVVQVKGGLQVGMQITGKTIILQND